MPPYICFFLSCFGDINITHKSDRFSLFPDCFNDSQELLSLTFLNSHYPELPSCASLHILMSLSFYCYWWAIFYFLPPWFALSFHSSSQHTIQTTFKPQFTLIPLSLSFLPFLLLFIYLFLVTALNVFSLTISCLCWSSWWTTQYNTTSW